MEKVEVNGGIGFLGVLTIVFIVLKLCSVVNWSWFWVLSPTIIPLILMIIMSCILFVLYYANSRRRTR